MWIFLGIILFTAVLITVVLLLPITIIISSDQNGLPLFGIKVLFFNIDLSKMPKKKKKKESPFAASLKKAVGIDKFKGETLKARVKEDGLSATAAELIKTVLGILKEIVKLLHHFTAKVFYIDVLFSGDDAAKTAITYGSCCAVVYPLTAALGSLIKIDEKGQNVNLRCGFDGAKEAVKYRFVLKVRVFRLATALLKILNNKDNNS